MNKKTNSVKTKTNDRNVHKTMRPMPADMRTPCMADGPTPNDMRIRALEWKAGERHARPYGLRETANKPHDTWCRFFYKDMDVAVCSFLDLLTDEEFERAAFVDRMDGEKYMMLVFTPPTKEWTACWNADIMARYADAIGIIRKKLEADRREADAAVIAKRVEEMEAYRIEKNGCDFNQAIRDMRRAAHTGASEGVKHTLPKAYYKVASMSDDALENAANGGSKRRKGGGRKKEFDLDNAQVEDAISLFKNNPKKGLRWACDRIIKNDKTYRNPYTDAKKLDAAVRRYKHIESKRKTGNWSSK